MNKILIIVIGVVFLAVVGGASFFGISLYQELSRFKSLGTYQELRTFGQENFDLKKQNSELKKTAAQVKREFLIFRKSQMADYENRSKRRLATSIASFTPISGTYVVAAVATQEQAELCQDVQLLLKLESKMFDGSDNEAEGQKIADEVCNTYLERKLTPLFKYQMLRVRASMTGSLGHLRQDAEDKFERARKLLAEWNIPVDSKLESYASFK